MSENRLHYTVYFKSRAQAAAWAAETQEAADKPPEEQSRLLSAMLGLDDGTAVSFEFASPAKLLA